MQQIWQGPSRHDYHLWVITCAAAELIGIGAGAMWWIAMDRIEPDPVSLAAKAAMLGLKSLSGLLEGILLGSLQAMVLRRIYPRLPLSAWVGLTALLAIFGWGAGSAIPIFGAPGDQQPVEPPLFLVLAFASLFGVLVGALFGGVQALALRRAALHSHWWIIVNAAGWGIALPVIYAAASLPDESWTLWQILASGLASGIIAGVLLGAVTGLGLWRIAPRQIDRNGEQS